MIGRDLRQLFLNLRELEDPSSTTLRILSKAGCLAGSWNVPFQKVVRKPKNVELGEVDSIKTEIANRLRGPARWLSEWKGLWSRLYDMSSMFRTHRGRRKLTLEDCPLISA